MSKNLRHLLEKQIKQEIESVVRMMEPKLQEFTSKYQSVKKISSSILPSCEINEFSSEFIQHIMKQGKSH